MPACPTLIVGAECGNQPNVDVLINDGVVADIGCSLHAPAGAIRVSGEGGALLPGLNDHHIHLAALAAAQQSLRCGPPEVVDANALADALRRASETTDGWLRGLGYHESVAGEIDAAWLDDHVADVPVRIQHRGGRLWVFNSCALQRLGVGPADPFERTGGKLTGRLYEGDGWLRERLASLGEGGMPDLSGISKQLASFGVVAVTDTGPRNGLAELNWLGEANRNGELLQTVAVMGSSVLNDVSGHPHADLRSARKFHLLESALPDIDRVIEEIRHSHAAERRVAFHCVTRTELVFALAAIREAGCLAGDRIEHASVTPPECMADIAELDLTVVTQPQLVHERGDQYLQSVHAEDQLWLYRLQGFLDAGIKLAGSSDAPYGSHNPWLAMHAAVMRETREGKPLGSAEALTAEQALRLYTAPLDCPDLGALSPKVGDVANLCLIRQNWAVARENLSEVAVRCCLREGNVIHADEVA